MAEDNEILEKMVSAFTALKVYDDDVARTSYFYSGYSDQEKEGVWQSAVNDKLLSWNNWADRNPRNTTTISDCAKSSLQH